MSFRDYVGIHKALETLETRHGPEGMLLPPRGIYIHYEDGETFQNQGRKSNRIVRIGVGTGNPNGLRTRLNAHYSFQSLESLTSFQIMIYKALANEKRKIWHRMLETTKARELKHHMRCKMSFKVIDMDDKDTQDIHSWEKALIATLAPYSSLFATDDWLGRHHLYMSAAKNYTTDSDRKSKVPSCGLWNETHVRSGLNEFGFNKESKTLAKFKSLVRQSRKAYG